MNDIIIQVYSNRKLSKKTIDIGNMQESKVTNLIFELDEDITALGGNVYLFVSYDGNTYPYPLKDNAIEIDRELTQRKKTLANIVVSTSEDSEEPLKDVVWISNTLTLLTDKNSINIDSINEQELPPSLKIIYDQLLNLEKDLQEKKESDYWKGDKGDKGDTGEISLEYARQNFSNSIISTTSGTSIPITDSAKAKPKNIKLFGKTNQPTTEGNQLFDAKTVLATQIEAGLVTVNDDGSVTLNGTFDYSNRDFYVSLKAGSYYFDEPNLILHHLGNGDNHWHNAVTITEDTELRCYIDSTTIYSNITIYPIISVSQDAELEPYTGGEASPNMNYEQLLNSHGDSGSIELALHGGNLCAISDDFFNIGGATDSSQISHDITDECITINMNLAQQTTVIFKTDILEVGKTYHVNLYSADGDFIGERDTTGFSVFFRDNMSNIITITEDMITSNNYGRYYLQCAGTSAKVGTYKYRIALSENDNLQTWEAKKEKQTMTALTPNGLPGIPLGTTIPNPIKNSPIHMAGVYWDNATSQYHIGDTVELESGEYVQRIWEQECTKDYYIAELSQYAGVYENHVHFRMTCGKNFIPENHLLCTRMLPKAIWGYDVFGCFVYANASDKIDFTVPYSVLGITKEATAEERKVALHTWLESNTLTFQCILADPIENDLTEEELAEYNALVMNYPNTTIVNDAGAYMEVEYVADTQEHIKQNYTPKSVTEDILERLGNLETQIANQ